jgi:predicted amidophosphoribosyltransferase
MPLIKCPACNKDVSSEAPACPACGQPIKSSVEKAAGGAINPRDPVHLLGIILVIGIVIGVILYIASAIK